MTINLDNNTKNKIVRDILKEGSYLMYEFKDKDVVYGKDKFGNLYTKKISPLYDFDVIENYSNLPLLDIILSDVPYYHLKLTSSLHEDNPLKLNINRDGGIVNVPSPLQHDFWFTWFRDAISDIHNSLLLDIYNKMRYPIVNENHYLNAKLFPKLAAEAFTDDEANEKSLLTFKYTYEDNLEDIKNGENGCLTYLDGVVAQKLDAIYSLIGYNPDQSELLSSWASSKYMSGAMDETSIISEKSVFRLQDIQYELLRRKFAGSSTLYLLTLASIDKRGSFLGAIPAGRLMADAINKFKDQRLIRVINIPGILSTYVDMSENQPFDIYYQTPFEEHNKYIPLGIVTPLFYTSAGWDEYSSLSFYKSGKVSKALSGDDDRVSDSVSPEEFRSKFLRDNSKIIDWSIPSGIISSRAVNTFYPRLDLDSSGNYKKLDSKYKYEDPNDPLHIIEVPMALDIAQAFFSTRSISANFLDINADQIMYHSNIIQKEFGNQYKFPIYHIAEGNSLSLMDTSWINYLKSSTEYKSKIQDDILYGTQISNYHAINNTMQLIPKAFFGISYGMNDYFEGYFSYDHFSTPPRYAFIWYCEMKYNAANFKLQSIKNTLISRVTLPINSSRYDEELLGTYLPDGTLDPDNRGAFYEFRQLPEFTELQEFSQGIIPLTYSLKDIDSMHLGPFSRDSQSWSFSDDITLSGYNKVAFAFSDNPSLSDRSFFQKVSADTNNDGNNDVVFYFDSSVIYDGPSPATNFNQISPEPTKNTKVFYYVVDRIGYDPQGKTVHRYIWSEPIRVFALNNELMNSIEDAIASDLPKYEIKPDWMDLQYYFNPYLNFTQESASPVRHKNLPPSIDLKENNISQEFIDKICVGPSESVGLVSLACERNKHYLCNDEGNLYKYFEDNIFTPKEIGYFLERFHPEYKEIGSGILDFSNISREYSRIYGDNRSLDIYSGSGEKFERTKPYTDENHNLCLNFTPGNYMDQAQLPYEKISYNYLRLSPFDTYKFSKSNGNEIYYEVEKEFPVYSKDKEIIGHEKRKVLELLEGIKEKDIQALWSWEKPTDGFSVNIRFRISNQVNNPKYTQEEICLIERRPFGETPDGKVDSEFSIRLIREEPLNTLSTDKGKFPEYRYKIRFDVYHVGSNKISYRVESIPYETPELSSSPVFITATLSTKEINYFETESNIRLIVNAHSYESIYRAICDENSSKIEIYKDGELQKELGDETSRLISLNNVSYNPNSVYKLSKLKFIPGFPIKYWDGSNFDIKYINIASSVEGEIHTYGDEVIQHNIFIGQIYDIRLYNSSENILVSMLRNSGHTRELYSHAPSSYKLAQSIYDDIGYFKQFKLRDAEDADNIPVIKTIRLLSRSVWDTIMVDEYPVSEAETSRLTPQYRPDWSNPEDDYDIYDKNGNTHVITQDLIANGEVVNNKTPDNQFIKEISYRNITHELSDKDKVSLVTTSLYPVFYENHLFESKGKFKQKDITEEKTTLFTDKHIYIPARAVGDTLKYSADLDINFSINESKHLDNFYSRGSNIELIYNAALGIPSVRLKSTAAKSSQVNHILIPMTIPIQQLSMGTQGFLDRLILRNYQLASNFTSLLRSQVYYEEMMIPVTFQDSLKSEPYFKPKWIGIRSLREGTYYFTTKYPIQFLPFLDFDKNTTLSAKYASLYASARFKIEVKGHPIAYDKSKYEIKGRPTAYLKNNLQNTLVNGNTLYKPNDNRTYPHRIIDIDLYVMDCQGDFAGLLNIHGDEAYTFEWKKVATNHPTEEESKKNIIILDNKTMEEPLVLNAPLPLFFSKNYTSPFFIAKYKKGQEASEIVADSADDDIISPIQVLPAYSGTSIQLENLQANCEDDLDKLCMVAGRPYKLLFDYTAKVTELSYTDKFFENSLILDDEKINYTRLVNINDVNISPQDYSYTKTYPWYTTKDLSGNKTSGFDTIKDGWKEIPENWLPNKNTTMTFEGFKDNLMSADGNYLRMPIDVLYVNMSDAELIKFESESAPDEYENLSEEEAKEFKKKASWKLTKVPGKTIIKGKEKEYIPAKITFDIKHIGKDDNGKPTIISTDIVTQNEYGVWNFNNQDGPSNTSYIIDNSNIFYFGNPYSRSSKANYLYKLSNNNRQAVDNLAYFPYVIYDVPEDMVYPAQYKNQKDAIENRFANQRTINQGLSPYTASVINDFPEASIINSVWKNISVNAINNINSITANPYGLIQTLSEISPRFEFRTDEAVMHESIIMSSDYDLYSYTAKDTKIPSKNPDIVITRRGLYSNNILRSQDFKDSAIWTIDYPCDYQPDDDWDNQYGKDVIHFNWGLVPESEKSKKVAKELLDMGYGVKEGDNISLKLIPQVSAKDKPIIVNYVGGFTRENTIFETAISLKSNDINNLMVYCRYYSKNNLVKEVRLKPSQFSQKSKSEPYTVGMVNLRIADEIDQLLGVSQDIIRKVNPVDPYKISRDLFNNKWYVFSNETKEKIEADDIEYEFVYSPYTYRRFISCLKKDMNKINLSNLPTDIKYFDMLNIRDYKDSFIDDAAGVLDVKFNYENSSFSVEFTNGDSLIQDAKGNWLLVENPDPNKFSLLNVLQKIPIDGENSELMDMVSLDMTKAVLRTSKSSTHYLGLSDILKPISTSPEEAEVIISSHPILLFKNKEIGNIVPFQFDNKCKKRMASNDPNPGDLTYAETSQIETQDFIRQYTLDNNTKTFMKKLLKPWARRVYFWDKWESTDDPGVFQDNRVIFYPYVIQTDSMGMRKSSIIKTPVNDVFTVGESLDIEGHKLPGMLYDETDGYIHINALNVWKSSTALNRFGENISIYGKDPVSLNNEKFTALSNCFHPEKFKLGMSSPIAITNIQLLSDHTEEAPDGRILFEYEYFPIIYDENTQHISINLYLHKAADKKL